MSNINFGVIGAGVVGISNALELQKQYPNAQVDIISEIFDQDTTSDGAAGLWLPTSGFSGPSQEIEYKWLKNSFDSWLNLGRQSEPSIIGIQPLSGTALSNRSLEAVKVDSVKDILPTYKFLKGDELEIYNGKWRYGLFMESLLIENYLFLPYAYLKFKQNGGRIFSRKVNSFDEISKLYNFDMIFNCTGFGSKYLCNDSKLYPVRGQVRKVKAPWISQFVFAEEEVYIIPGITKCTVGGTHDFGHYNLEVDPFQSHAIRVNSEKVIPSLKNAELIKEWVGLRPMRIPIRVESEVLLNSNGKQIKLVHNYGHGGCGVTLAPGTSKHALELSKDLFFVRNKL